MSLPLFYESDFAVNNPNVYLSEETSKHCIQVLRMQNRAHLQVTDGKGQLHTATIINANKKFCEVKVEKSTNNAQKIYKTSIAISLLKNSSRLEWFMEKATELGTTEIIPLICERTEKQTFRWERMNNILISSMLQSQQAWLPVLHQTTKFTDLINMPFQGKRLIAHCVDLPKININESLQANDQLSILNYQLLIGPEGDFTSNEINVAIENNFTPVSLGATRLRTETAGIVGTVWLTNFNK